MQLSNINPDVEPQLGEAAVPRRHNGQSDYDSGGSMVVAIIWLLLYGAVLSGLTLSHGAEILTSIAGVFP